MPTIPAPPLPHRRYTGGSRNHLYRALFPSGTWGAFTRIPGIEDAASAAVTTDVDGKFPRVHRRTDRYLPTGSWTERPGDT
ncbi:hypothetical protein [Streptomyces tubercidicus]|uniref:hypothetical protein n=1 Tax=Streptomyces tubercidicus TaxID=47759 RepID=UPI0036C2CD9A